MNYLTPHQVLFLHSRLIDEIGGSHGVRDVGLLESAVERPKATFGGEELYPDLFSKAAAIMLSLILNHPFVDGNKRTAIASAAMFLLLNGRKLNATPDELQEFTLRVADRGATVDEVARWLREHSEPIRSKRLLSKSNAPRVGAGLSQ